MFWTTPTGRASVLAEASEINGPSLIKNRIPSTFTVRTPNALLVAIHNGVPAYQLNFKIVKVAVSWCHLCTSGTCGCPAYALRSRTREFFWDSNRYPCQKPPWGNLTAVDLNTGRFRWRVTLGEFDEFKARGIPKTGAPNIGGSIVTAGGLIFIGATDDGKFRAFDKDTGHELWVTRLPASGFATPMTYFSKRTGKQYVVIAAGGGNKYDRTFTGKMVAFSLP